VKQHQRRRNGITPVPVVKKLPVQADCLVPHQRPGIHGSLLAEAIVKVLPLASRALLLTWNTGFNRHFCSLRFSHRSADDDTLVPKPGHDLHLATERPNVGADRGDLGPIKFASLQPGNYGLRDTETFGDIVLIQAR
jgi:hypothetical protein